MQTAYKDYLFEEIDGHIERIADLAEKEDPDLECIEYHHGKAKKALNLLKEITDGTVKT